MNFRENMFKEKMFEVLQNTLDNVKYSRDNDDKNCEEFFMNEFWAYCRYYFMVTGEFVEPRDWKVVVVEPRP